tara:strand:- start:566 stop:1531 length:966 start_codon:yes stop_codon:yes gene_type:complete
MNNENDGWAEVDVSAKPEEQEQIEFELEEEEKVEEKQEAQPEEPKIEEPQVEEEETPKELEGIETKGAEKRIRQLIRQRKEREETIQTLLAQNEELKNNLSKKDKEVVSITSNSLNANEQSLEKTIKMAKEAYLEAFDSGEKEKVLEAQETLNNAQADLKMLQRMKVNAARQQQELEAQEVQPEPQVQQQPQPTAVDVKAQEWAEQNDWFGEDTIKTAAALALDAELKSEGYDPNDNEFYEEIDRRLEKAFGGSSVRVEENTSQPSQVVSGASRSSQNSRSKVKLSKEDVRLANKWGIPLEQYAAEKLKVTTADGEYTNII